MVAARDISVRTTAGAAAVQRSPSSVPAAARPDRRNAFVSAYIALALVVVAFGWALKNDLLSGLDPHLDAVVTSLRVALEEIRFGETPRFWFGVTGAIMMALLLAYPLRKALGLGRLMGTVAAWFHLHILLGLIGPVLILYHVNFVFVGSKVSDAKVALWCMLVVALSGIVGYFVYGRVSRDFYATKQQALRHREALIAGLPALDQHIAWKQQLITTLDGIETELLSPRQGLVASFSARLRVEQHRRVLGHNVGKYIDGVARRSNMPPAEHRRLNARIGGHLRTYFGLARSAAGQSLMEQLWAHWRLLHFPVFLVMVVAIGLHVATVWDRAPAGPAAAPSTPLTVPAAPVERRNATQSSKPGDPRTVGLDRQIKVADQAGEDAATTTRTVRQKSRERAVDAGPASTPAALAEVQVTSTPKQLVMRPLPDAQPQAGLAPGLIAPPEPVARSRTAPAPVLALPPKPALPPSAPTTTAVIEAQPAQPAQPARATAMPPPAAVALPQPPLPDSSPAAKLGGPQLSAALLAQFEKMKEKKAAGQPFHSEAETGFALTNKHLKLDCEKCHEGPQKVSRSSDPRTCVDCHKKDDNHQGRQTDCGSCHTTNRWTQIVRRKVASPPAN